jgi:hypothetical protein
MQRWIPRLIMLALLCSLACIIFSHPIATNDGPVHVDFSNLILHLHQPGHMLQNLAYVVRLRPNPNLAAYLLMSALMNFFTPPVVESIVQFLCLAAPVAAGYFALRAIEKKNAWLALFILPLSLNQMYFFGLYNHCFSIAAFFLAMGCYFRLRKAPSIARAAALSGALILTFLCHAGGFIMAFAGVGTITGTLAVLSCLRSRNAMAAIKEQRYVLGAMLAPLPFAAVFLAGSGHSMTMYGIWFSSRVKQFVTLHLLAVNHPTVDRFPALAISGTLLAAGVFVAWRVFRNRAGWPQDQQIEKRDLAIATIAAGVMAIVIMLAFPDVMGGGWTHYRRFQIFPYFWILMLLAFDTFTLPAMAAMEALATCSAVMLIVSMVTQQRLVRDQLKPIDDLDRLVASHCTLLPIMTRYRPVGAYDVPVWMQYQPLFQAVSRLELNRDRVVLFNYLARLDAYPVHFKPGVEPQEHMFLWPPQHFETSVEKIDIAGFEKSSGLRVDYLVLWGDPRWRPLPFQQQIQHALDGFAPIYKSNDGETVLYERETGRNSMCEAVPLGPAIATMGAGK